MLKKELRHNPEMVNHRLPCEQTLLHIALPWPQGVSILLAAGANIAPDQNILSDACWLGNSSSIPLLLDHGCLINLSSSVFSSRNIDLQKLVVSHLVRRRNRLGGLAANNLSGIDFQSPNLRKDRVLNAQADVVAPVLSRTGVEIDLALSLLPTTVYHATTMNVKMGNLLYDAGFRDFDEVDALEMSPFWTHVQYDMWKPLEKLSVLAWLRDKGVDMYRRHPVGRMMAIHAVGRLLGSPRLCFGIGRMSSEQQEQTGLFLSDRTTDDCKCACSRTGCQALAFALADCGPFTHKFRPNTKFNIDFSCCLQVRRLVKSHVPDNQWIPAKAIRAMSFRWLELTHTCHASLVQWHCGRLSVKAPLSMDEINEIQEEERDLIQQLEDLVAEFEAKFDDLGIPLIPFLEEHWKPRMDEVLRANDEEKKEEKRRMRELGVTIGEESSLHEIADREDEDWSFDL